MIQPPTSEVIESRLEHEKFDARTVAFVVFLIPGMPVENLRLEVGSLVNVRLENIRVDCLRDYLDRLHDMNNLGL